MPTFLQIAGFACLVAAYILAIRPVPRPGTVAYLGVLAADLACILFMIGMLCVWPSWWLLAPMLLWSATGAVHALRLRHAHLRARRALAARRHPSRARRHLHPVTDTREDP